MLSKDCPNLIFIVSIKHFVRVSNIPLGSHRSYHCLKLLLLISFFVLFVFSLII